ncbi:MAG: VWA domain-containing protein [Gemmatimonadaceae bacterium]|nr:VWA domain-containing protein [Gemmatimonadaceae bacterium]
MNLGVASPLLLIAALLGAPLAAWAVWYWHVRRVRRVERVATPEAVARLIPTLGGHGARWRAARLGTAMGCALIALAGPRWGAATETIRSEGIDVVLALDASKSMLADDERPSRLERMKQEVRRWRAASPGDRVGIIAFAGRAYVLSPLTADDGALGLFLDNLDPSIVGEPGSALAPAMEQAVNLLDAAKGDADRAIVLLSDGEAFDDLAAARTVARRAGANGIHLVTVGFGTPGGSTIPLEGAPGEPRRNKLDGEGNEVITKYEAASLQALAEAARGDFIPADAADKGRRIARALDGLAAGRRESAAGLARPDRFQWFLLPALLLLLLDAWRVDGVRVRWRRRAALLVAMIVAPAGTASAQSTNERHAVEAHAARRFDEAIFLWRQEIAGRAAPRLLYNLGTSLLGADSLDTAIDALERASLLGDRALREQALFNLGLARLRRSRTLDGEDQRRALESAIASYKALLRLRPTDADARWNYELALETQQQQSQTNGGSRDDPEQPPEPQGRAPQTQSGPMSKSQAQQLLDAAARDERDTQKKRRTGRNERVAGGKDW